MEWPLVGFKKWHKDARDGKQAGIRCQRDRSVASAYQTALKKKDDIAIALALSPFARKTAELVNSGAYEAAGSCYAIFRCLAKTCKENEDWFAGFTGYGDISDARGTGQWHQLKLRV